MAIEDDDKPRKKITHEIGQDLSLLSVEELTERIALMNSRNRTAAAGGDEEARVEGCGEQFFQVVDFRTSSLRTQGPIRRGPSCDRPLADFPQHHRRRWSCPAFAGTTTKFESHTCPKLGQWPTWQIIPEENRSFTID